MSSFIVSKKHINKIVAGLGRARQGDDYPSLRGQSEILFVSEADEARADFGQDLYEMNVWAVEDRYPDTVENHQYPGEVDKDGNHVPYEYERVSPPSALELYKLIRCYLYQCSEGDIDKKPLFIALDTYCQSVAEHIVMNSPQYDALPWDI